MAEFILGNPLRKLARKHRPLANALQWLDFALVWVVVQFSRMLPVDLGSRLGRRVGALIGPRLGAKNEIVLANLAIAFPDKSPGEREALAREVWGQAGRVLTEYAHLEDILNDPERLDIVIRQEIPTYSDPSRPCVVVTAHQSNWEVVCSAMAKMGMPNASLYSPPSNPKLDRMLLESRRALNCELVPRENAARPLMRALQSGRTAAMVMDRRVPDGSPIRFFGREKESTLLPAKLALKFGCDMVPVQVERLVDAQYRVTFHPPITASNPDADENSRAEDMIQQVHGHFEQWVYQHPEDWFCSKRLWAKVKMKKSSEAQSAVES